jgi:hypothetical protein
VTEFLGARIYLVAVNEKRGPIYDMGDFPVERVWWPAALSEKYILLTFRNMFSDSPDTSLGP